MEIKTTEQIIRENITQRKEEWSDKPITTFHNVDVKWVRVPDVKKEIQRVIDKSISARQDLLLSMIIDELSQSNEVKK